MGQEATGTYRRGNDTSNELVEVRTVLSRAETALQALDRIKALDGGPDPWADGYGYEGDGIFRADPDIDDMITALQETVRRLDRYRRTGRTRRGNT